MLYHNIVSYIYISLFMDESKRLNKYNKPDERSAIIPMNVV